MSEPADTAAPQTLAEAFQDSLTHIQQAQEHLAHGVWQSEMRAATAHVIGAVISLSGIVNALMWNDTNAETHTKQRIALARFVNVYANRERLDADALQIQLFETWLQAVGAMGLQLPKDAHSLPVGSGRWTPGEVHAYWLGDPARMAELAEAVTNWQAANLPPRP